MSPSPAAKYDLCGYAVILLWSFAAVAVGWTTQIPPILLPGLTSLIGFFFFALSWVRNPAGLMSALRQPWPIWVLFFVAVVVYRGLYLAGLKTAPIVEANLLNYLWPLLIVLLPAVFDGQKLSRATVLGALACFAGVVCIGLSKKETFFSFEAGHVLAIGGAFAWASYSVLTRRFSAAPTDMIGLMHLVAAVLFMSLHAVFEQPVDWPAVTPKCWAGVVMLGVAISLGYGLWDRAMTHGNREKVALAAYYTPLLSTFWLIVFGDARLSLYVWCAAALILGGSLYARLKSR